MISDLKSKDATPSRPTCSGAYLHVVYRVLPNHRVRVFHINGMTEAQKRRYRRYRK